MMTHASLGIPSPIVTSTETINRLVQELETKSIGHYAILDACDEPKIPPKVQELGERAVSLYRGTAEVDYWAIAPYLVQLDRELLDWIVQELWGAPWGVLLGAATTLEKLRKHLRRYLIVSAPDGRRLYFRFYDPRVLTEFMASCTAKEVEQFHGPIEWFGAPGKNSVITMSRRATKPLDR